MELHNFIFNVESVRTITQYMTFIQTLPAYTRSTIGNIQMIKEYIYMS